MEICSLKRAKNSLTSVRTAGKMSQQSSIYKSILGIYVFVFIVHIYLWFADLQV